jgi:hypothetical protein
MLANSVQFEYAASAWGVDSNGTFNGFQKNAQTKVLTVLQPCVGITKNCSSTCTPYGQPVAFSGIITNCSVLQANPSDGNLYFTTNSLSDNPTATITYSNKTTLGNSFPVDGNGGILAQGDSVAYSGSYQPTNVCGPFDDTITVVAADLTGFTVTNSASVECTICPATPCLQVTKNCAASPIDFALQTSYTVSGMVTNCGDIPLTNVIVFDIVTDQNGVVTTNGPIQIGNLDPHTIALVPNQTNSATGCGTITDYFVAIGSSQCFGNVTNNSSTCTTVFSNTPCMAVVKNCGPASVTGGTAYQVSGYVTNCGTGPLTSVVVNDVVTTPDGTKTTNSVALGSTTVASHTALSIGPITITPTQCGPYSDYFTLSANGLCSNPAGTTSQTCITTNRCPPLISVSKLVTCAPAAGIAGCNSTLNYKKNAYGIAGVNNPAFCYQIIVSNIGPVALTNVTLSDSVLTGDGVILINPPSGFLDVGQSVTNYYGASWGVGNHTNTVVATGVSVIDQSSVSATNSAATHVVALTVCCTNVTLYSSVDMDNNTNDNHVTLPTGPTNTPVQITFQICDYGPDDATFTLTGLPQLYTDDSLMTTSTIPTTVSASNCVTISGWMVVSCGSTPINLNITVQGTATSNTNYPCIYDSSGNVIVASTCQNGCQAKVECQQPVTCRVTGGGTLYAGDISINCTNVTTVLLDDLADDAGLAVNYISHGGQLGAPFSQMDCSNRLANPCIRGEWEHVRHYDNKNNGVQDVFDMNFHTANPNITGHFDTLMCACLPCCSNGTNYVGNQPAPPGWSNLKFKVCNPDDRRICGPLPSPAPANAIIFTGIGTLTPGTNTANGKKAVSRYVIFRVYIEDRSDPGGIHPGGAKMPATVYCFQAWDTGIATSKQADFTTLASQFRTQLSADSCAFLTSMSNGTFRQGTLPSTTVAGMAADVVDQGPLHDGSQQIHPATDATCTQ